MTPACSPPRPTSPLRNERGNTMAELLIVVAVIGILSSVAVAGYGYFSNKAKAAVLPIVARFLKVELDSTLDDTDLAHRYGTQSYDTRYLNGRLEKAWEKTAGSNIFGHRNPFSGKGTVLNWAAIPLSVGNPAIFITNHEQYAYDALPNDEIRPELRGSVVIHLANNVRQIDIFYFDLEARKSDFRLVAGLSQ